MALLEKSEIRNITDIAPDKLEAICRFLQGAVYCWCKNRPNEWFAMRDLMGGENFYWEGTPLIALYQKQLDLGKEGDEALKGAAIDSGWILKKVIDEDKRRFETKKKDLVRMYRWDGDSSY